MLSKSPKISFIFQEELVRRMGPGSINIRAFLEVAENKI